jgi:hypothetical protein
MTADASSSTNPVANGAREVADGIRVFHFPLKLLGTQMGRRTTVIRLRTGELVIHSTGPFSESVLKAIHALGRPAWLVEATLFHDTFAAIGCAAFPGVPYLAPPGFRAASAQPLLPEPPAGWAGELEILELEGMPRVREHVFFHRPSRTLIVADLVFNFGPQSTRWTRWFFQRLGGVRSFPGMSRLFRLSIKDRAAFAASVERMLAWDFDRCIVAHGDIIESNAKAVLRSALAKASAGRNRYRPAGA